METTASTVAIIDEDRSPIPAQSSRRTTLGALIIGALIVSLAVLRATVVVVATPIGIWAQDDLALLDTGLIVDAEGRHRAAVLSRIVADARLVRNAKPNCFGAIQSGQDAELTQGETDCALYVDDALRANPASGELWLFKAGQIGREGKFQQMQTALYNSYQTAPNEGWLASERVVLGLKLYPALNSGLQKRVHSDLRLVLTEPALAAPLVSAYAVDPMLRVTAGDSMHELSADEIRRFISMVRQKIMALDNEGE